MLAIEKKIVYCFIRDNYHNIFQDTKNKTTVEYLYERWFLKENEVLFFIKEIFNSNALANSRLANEIKKKRKKCHNLFTIILHFGR